MPTTPPLSAVIITFNERDYIAECIDSVRFASEIVVVDSFSTDGTWEWLQAQPGIKASQHPFTNYTLQKSHALNLASHDWIYFLDADERVPPKLQQEILETITSSNPKSAYWNTRTFMFGNRRLRFSGWQTDKVLRLFRKSRCRFIPERIVHETLEFKGDAGYLKARLLHYSYKNYRDYRGKMVKYGKMRAVEAFEKGQSWSLAHQWLRPFWKFFNHYMLRLGVLDGDKGIIICYLNALGVYERFRELKRLKDQQKALSKTVK